ncbi:MAG: PadR family transcriptional regulator [Candidatus Bathyarchaeota archaeon]
MAYKRLVSKITKENLWLYILKMLMDRPMYAYEMSKGLEERFGFSTATITVYVVLYKMHLEGLIKMGEKRAAQGRPTRKYYEITTEGQESFLNGKTFLEGIVHILS